MIRRAVDKACIFRLGTRTRAQSLLVSYRACRVDPIHDFWHSGPAMHDGMADETEFSVHFC
jgi:hypothetical protein